MPRYKSQDNIKMDIRERGMAGMGWIHLVRVMDQWWALVNTEGGLCPKESVD
jgi:hypothetical protein